MPKYPLQQFRLEEHEAATIEALSSLIKEKVSDLAKWHLFNLRQMERGNATLTAWHRYGTANSSGAQTQQEVEYLLRRLKTTVRRINLRAHKVLSKRVRTNPHITRKANGKAA